MINFFKKIGRKLADFFKWLFKQLKDVKNLIIFIVVFLILSSEVWLFYLLGIITGNGWFFGVASVCWAFWLGPFTPFLPIVIAITLAIRKIIDKISGKKVIRDAKTDGKKENDADDKTDKTAEITDNKTDGNIKNETDAKTDKITDNKTDGEKENDADDKTD